MQLIKNIQYLYNDLSGCIKILAADAIEKANSGHPGMVCGMSDVMTVLLFNFFRFNPNEPKWLNRDRFILSNGHGSMLLYSIYYLTGYKDFVLDDIKNFRQLHAKTPGHPEYGVYEAIEATTGPLGQGIANAVGMAIAEKKYQVQLGSSIVDYKIYCMVGDGCLMEGISYEAISIAGHLKLNNLIVLFDDNMISIDGSTSLSISEDHIQKFIAFGWEAERIDGHNFQQIQKALQRAQNSNKPYFIACRNIIAKGCRYKAGSEKSHGAPLGAEEITFLKSELGAIQEDFIIADELLSIWREAWLRNKEFYDNWQIKFARSKSDDQIYLSTNTLIAKDILLDFNDCNTKQVDKPESTRVSSGKIIEYLSFSQNKKLIFGSADLSFSNNIKNKCSKIINSSDFTGNFIHYGVREHAMAAIMNGLALSGFIPIGGTFLAFSDYMKPAIRLSALMNLHVIYIMTHDSIAVGEDGPTHQPVEHLASMRALPNLLVLRPADFAETVECWDIALSHAGPSMLVLTRQNVPQIRTTFNLQDNLVRKGAYYVLFESAGKNNLDVMIFASGSELNIAINTAHVLKMHNIIVEVVSVPCFELFFMQDPSYISAITERAKLNVAIEAGSEFGWHKIIGKDGMFFGINHFGLSAPGDVLYEHFKLSAEYISETIIATVNC